MKRTVLVGCVLVSLVPQLAGCTVFRQIGLAPHSKPKEHLVVQDAVKADTLALRARSSTEQQLPVPAPSVLTNIARDQLAAGNFGLAIETFRLARGAGEPLAPVLNGLGVAYAHLGRADLAANNFRLAIARDPDEERYRWNLSKLLAQTEMARARDQVELYVSPGPAAEPDVAGQAGKLVKVSPGQFVIRTVNFESAKPVRSADVGSVRKRRETKDGLHD